MEPKLPFYKMYPSPFLYDPHRLTERDYEYLKSLYSDLAKTILPYVEEECDRQEYEGSMMFDEYPDKLQVRLMGNRILKKIQKEETIEIEDRYLRELMEVILYQELIRRREQRRNRYRKALW